MKKERPKSRFVQELESHPEVEVDERYQRLIVQYEKERKRSAFFYKQVGQLETKVDKITKIYNNVNDALQTQEDLNKNLQNRLEEKELMVLEFQKQVELCSKESYELKMQAQPMLEENRSLKEQISMVNSEMNELRFQYGNEEKLQTEIADLKKEMNEKEKDTETKYNELKMSHSDQIQSYMNTINELQALTRRPSMEDYEEQTEPEIKDVAVRINSNDFGSPKSPVQLKEISHIGIQTEAENKPDRELPPIPSNIEELTMLNDPDESESPMATLERLSRNEDELKQLIVVDDGLNKVDKLEEEIRELREKLIDAEMNFNDIYEIQIELFDSFDKLFPQHRELDSKSKLTLIDSKLKENTQLASELILSQHKQEELRESTQLEATKLNDEFIVIKEQYNDLQVTHLKLQEDFKVIESEKTIMTNAHVRSTLEDRKSSDATLDGTFSETDTAVGQELTLDQLRQHYLNGVMFKQPQHNQKLSVLELALDDLASCLSRLMMTTKFQCNNSNDAMMMQLTLLSTQIQEMRQDMVMKDVEIRSLRDKNELLRDRARVM